MLLQHNSTQRAASTSLLLFLVDKLRHVPAKPLRPLVNKPAKTLVNMHPQHETASTLFSRRNRGLVRTAYRLQTRHGAAMCGRMRWRPAVHLPELTDIPAATTRCAQPTHAAKQKAKPVQVYWLLTMQRVPCCSRTLRDHANQFQTSSPCQRQTKETIIAYTADQLH